ncbi:hypothetical protein [Candidatus Lokiarchaeum ossiferum]|uniref:hypothetical protein n=1 Tax=Candidatus Lokiarchaeum ossiferum TaxID=2951803 RepID=UPI00352DDAEB
MLHMILTETALEMIPSEYDRDPIVKKWIQKFNNAARLLDTSLHHHLLAKLKNSEKRGRPDILHHFLLDTLGSPANFAGEIKIYFHTKSALYSVSSDMRCPRDYHRFKALMVQLLEVGNIPKKKPYFIRRETENFTHWITSNFHENNVYQFTANGEKIKLKHISDTIVQSTEDSAVLIGGFQKGHFSATINKLPGQKIALPDRGYDSWVVVNRVLTFYEQSKKILK